MPRQLQASGFNDCDGLSISPSFNPSAVYETIKEAGNAANVYVSEPGEPDAPYGSVVKMRWSKTNRQLIFDSPYNGDNWPYPDPGSNPQPPRAEPLPDEEGERYVTWPIQYTVSTIDGIYGLWILGQSSENQWYSTWELIDSLAKYSDTRTWDVSIDPPVENQITFNINETIAGLGFFDENDNPLSQTENYIVYATELIDGLEIDRLKVGFNLDPRPVNVECAEDCPENCVTVVRPDDGAAVCFCRGIERVKPLAPSQKKIVPEDFNEEESPRENLHKAKKHRRDLESETNQAKDKYLSERDKIDIAETAIRDKKVIATDETRPEPERLQAQAEAEQLQAELPEKIEIANDAANEYQSTKNNLNKFTYYIDSYSTEAERQSGVTLTPKSSGLKFEPTYRNSVIIGDGFVVESSLIKDRKLGEIDLSAPDFSTFKTVPIENPEPVGSLTDKRPRDELERLLQDTHIAPSKERAAWIARQAGNPYGDGILVEVGVKDEDKS